MMSYLKEVLTADYYSYSEDRLSQIFSASFNNSSLFRKVFLNTILGQSKNYSESSARTQINYGLKGQALRIDIILYQHNKPYLVIENKVDAPLFIEQLHNYDKIKELSKCKKVALVKHYFDPAPYGAWNIFHWSDLYSAFKKTIKKGIVDPVDKFVILNFLEHLEEMKMTNIIKISKVDLVNFSQGLNSLRTMPSPYLSLTTKNIFETGSQLLSILEDIIEMVRQEKELTKFIGRNPRFSPRIGSWAEYEDTKFENMSISVGFSVPKTKNEIKYIGTGFFFYKDNPKKYALMTYGQTKINGGGTFLKEEYYKRKDLIVEDYAKEVIDYWKKWVNKG